MPGLVVARLLRVTRPVADHDVHAEDPHLNQIPLRHRQLRHHVDSGQADYGKGARLHEASYVDIAAARATPRVASPHLVDLVPDADDATRLAAPTVAFQPMVEGALQ